MGCLVRGTQDSGTGKLGSGAFERKGVRCNAQQKPEFSGCPLGGVTLPGKEAAARWNQSFWAAGAKIQESWQLLFHAHFLFWCHT